MKISVFGTPQITTGKYSVKYSRLDELDKRSRAKKKTYLQVELAGEDASTDADAILTLKNLKTDLILKDLEFVETRLARAEEEKEKTLLAKLKVALEKEEFILSVALNEEEKKLVSAYSLITNRPVILAEDKDPEDINNLLARCVAESGFISFFTTGERETRAWLIKKGTTAWEAAGEVHSDIQRGFIRAEIISFNDFMQCGGEAQAKQTGKLRLEQKDYVMQDADLVNFRFNK